MKQRLVFLLIITTFSASSYCQCDKKYILAATGVEILNDENEVKMKDTERVTTIKYDSKIIEIITDFNTRHGTIDSIYCNWKIPFKEGNTYIRGTLNFENGEQWVIKLAISGNDGKLTLMADMEHPDANKMRFVLNKYEESK